MSCYRVPYPRLHSCLISDYRLPHSRVMEKAVPPIPRWRRFCRDTGLFIISAISRYNLLHCHILVPESDCALLILKMDGILRTVMNAGIADFTMIRKHNFIVDRDIICRTYFGTDTAFHTGIINNVVLCVSVRLSATLLRSSIVPHAAFITSTFPSSLNVDISSTGIGKIASVVLISFFIVLPSFLSLLFYPSMCAEPYRRTDRRFLASSYNLFSISASHSSQSRTVNPRSYATIFCPWNSSGFPVDPPSATLFAPSASFPMMSGLMGISASVCRPCHTSCNSLPLPISWRIQKPRFLPLYVALSCLTPVCISPMCLRPWALPCM